MCNKEHARARAAAQDKTVATWPALRTPLSVEESAVQASPWHPPKGAAPQAEEALDVNKKKNTVFNKKPYRNSINKSYPPAAWCRTSRASYCCKTPSYPVRTFLTPDVHNVKIVARC